MNVNNLEITMATFALNPIQFVSIPLVPTNVSNQNLTFNTVTGFVKFCPKIRYTFLPSKSLKSRSLIICIKAFSLCLAFIPFNRTKKGFLIFGQIWKI